MEWFLANHLYLDGHMLSLMSLLLLSYLAILMAMVRSIKLVKARKEPGNGSSLVVMICSLWQNATSSIMRRLLYVAHLLTIKTSAHISTAFTQVISKRYTD